MLTIFAIPKPFAGHDDITQRNAVGTWTRLEPACQVILCGDDAGVAEAAANLGVEHIPSVATNEFGTPILSSAFELAEDRASFDLMCYVNADILLMSDLLEATRRVEAERERFLLVGQRWDADLDAPLSFDDARWEVHLRERVQREGSLHPPSGSDYFVFPKGAVGTLPDFTVGRGGWDNWMLGRALERGLDLIDLTESTFVVHQNHGYAHVPSRDGHAWQGPETDRNLELVGGDGPIRTLEDAPYRLTPGGLVRRSRLKSLVQKLTR